MTVRGAKDTLQWARRSTGERVRDEILDRAGGSAHVVKHNRFAGALSAQQWLPIARRVCRGSCLTRAGGRPDNVEFARSREEPRGCP